MRKILVAIIAAGTMGVACADSLGQEQYQQQFRDQPEARAYLSYTFGGHSDRRAPAALHYGLRLDHESRIYGDSGLNGNASSGFNTMPALFQLDRDNRGETLFSANGIPFAGRNLRMNQSDSSGSSSSGGGSSDSGWSFFDWTLLAVGVGGAGYLIYDATKGHDSPDAQPASSSSGSSCVLIIICTKGLTASHAADADYVQISPAQLEWLDAGTGQMGDLRKH